MQIKTIVVERGDTLSAIAPAFTGNALLWTELHSASRDRVPDPHLIFPDTELRVPKSWSTKLFSRSSGGSCRA
jgi:nucleoid-associated protein YgaU